MAKKDDINAKAQAEAEAKVKAEAEAKKKADAKAQAEADAKADAEAELEEEAKTLGVTRSKTSFLTSKTKDEKKDVEIAYHNKQGDRRLRKRIKKAKANKLTPKQARKKQIKAMMTHRQNYPKAVIAQAKWELAQMNLGTWKKGKRMPKKGKTVYEEIMED